jgi:hypothetical protein
VISIRPPCWFNLSGFAVVFARAGLTRAFCFPVLVMVLTLTLILTLTFLFVFELGFDFDLGWVVGWSGVVADPTRLLFEGVGSAGAERRPATHPAPGGAGVSGAVRGGQAPFRRPGCCAVPLRLLAGRCQGVSGRRTGLFRSFSR